MQPSESYIGFPPLPDQADIVTALLNDPPDVRWRVVRQLFRIKDRRYREDLIQALQPYLYEVDDFRVKYRITLALQALHRPLNIKDYVLVKEKGAFEATEVETFGIEKIGESAIPNFFPVVDFHIHPKTPDLKFFADMHEAGVTHGVILATEIGEVDKSNLLLKKGMRNVKRTHERYWYLPFFCLVNHIK